MKAMFPSHRKPIKSLVLHYFIYGRVPSLGHNILNSSKTTRSMSSPGSIISQQSQLQQSVQQLTYQYSIKGTTMTFTKKIEFLENINECNILEWIKEFRLLLSRCGYDEEPGKLILRDLLHPNYLEKIETKKTLDNMLDTLIGLAYPAFNASKYSMKVKALKQEDFYLISDYQKAVTEQTYKLGMCKKWTENEIAKRTEEYLLENLHDHLKIQMIDYKENSFQELEARITLIEQKLLSSTSVLTQSDAQIQQEHTDQLTKTTKPKWCKYHRSSFHSDDECYKQSKSNKNQTSDTFKNHMVLKVPEGNAGLIEVKVEAEDLSINALIDSGSELNFINSEKADQLRGKSIKLDTPLTIEVANQRHVKIQNY